MDKIKKWLFCLLFTFLPFSLSLTISSPASAFTYGGTSYVSYPVVEVDMYDNTGYHTYIDGSNNQNTRTIYFYRTEWGGVQQDHYLTRVMFDFDTASTGKILPAHSLFSFGVRYLGSPGVGLSPITPTGDWELLNSNCTPIVNANNETYEITCQYYGITGNNNATVIEFNSRHKFPYGNARIQVPIAFSFVQVLDDSGGSSSGLSQADKDFIAGQITALQNSGSTNTTAILNALSQINSGQTTLNNAINQLKAEAENTTDAVNNPEWVQQEQEDLQDATDDAEDAADGAQDDVDGATSSLLSVLSNFLGVLTSVNASNCYLDGSLFPHLNLGQLNLCQNAPPAAITALGSLILIAFVIPLVYNTIKMIINLFSEFQR